MFSYKVGLINCMNVIKDYLSIAAFPAQPQLLNYTDQAFYYLLFKMVESEIMRTFEHFTESVLV